MPVRSYFPLMLSMKTHLSDFDEMVTAMVLDIMGVPEGDWDVLGIRVHTFRGLPLRLSGGSMRRAGGHSVRVSALMKARHSVGQYVHLYEPDMWECLEGMWGQEMKVLELDSMPGWVAKAGARGCWC